MDLRVGAFRLLILVSGICLLQARGGSGNSVHFLDGPENKYFRSRLEIGDEANSFSPLEVAATVSVLLGVAPASLTAESSTKLDKILLPNPFSRPRAVVMLEVQGIRDLSFNDGTWSSKIIGSGNAHIEIFDNEVSLTSIEESIECDSSSADRNFDDLARFLGGSYVGSVGSQDGILEFPLPSGTSLKLYLSKIADRAFTVNLLSLLNGVKMAIEIQEDLESSSRRPVQLLTGRFTGIKALHESGSVDLASQGLELFRVAVTRLFGLLQKAYQGEIVGVVMVNEEAVVTVEQLLSPPRSSRFLEEALPANTTIAEVLLVRTTLAWVTGVILLVSFFIGIYYLLYMPFTRDTLLYSNVKLD